MSAADSLTRAASRYDAAYTAALNASVSKSSTRAAALKSINQRLIQAERALTSNEGLTGRGWYKHLLYAPGFYTGYGVKTMPGPREAIEQGQWKDVDREIARVAAALEREATLVSSLADSLGRLK